jgi:sec-independent protein translocase protein TatC
MLSKNLTLENHLIEIRQRLIYSIIFFLLAFIASYYFIEHIYNFLLKPLIEIYGPNHEKRIIYTGLTEAFVTYVRLAFLSSLFFSTPFFISQFYLFISPALYKKEKRFIVLILAASPTLFLLGAILLYYFIFPLAFKFFVSFEMSGNLIDIPIELEARISEYLNLVVKLIFGFGIAFQLPILLIVLVKVGLITVKSLRQKRKYWILLIFISAAILTPPDIFSQVLLAIPMILLYEIAILISAAIVKGNNKPLTKNNGRKKKKSK